MTPPGLSREGILLREDWASAFGITQKGYPQIAQIAQILFGLRGRSGLAEQLCSPKTATASRPSRVRPESGIRILIDANRADRSGLVHGR
jgi:hypothetical protein